MTRGSSATVSLRLRLSKRSTLGDADCPSSHCIDTPADGENCRDLLKYPDGSTHGGIDLSNKPIGVARLVDHFYADYGHSPVGRVRVSRVPASDPGGTCIVYDLKKEKWPDVKVLVDESRLAGSKDDGIVVVICHSFERSDKVKGHVKFLLQLQTLYSVFECLPPSDLHEHRPDALDWTTSPRRRHET